MVRMSLDSTAQAVGATPPEGWHPIFNAEPMHGEFDGRHTGREPTDELPAECCAEAQRALKKADLLFEGHTVSHVVGARSRPGCERQAAHCDMGPTHPIFRQGWEPSPKSALCFPGGGEFCVHPPGLSCKAAPIVAPAPAQVAVVFLAGLRHCGAPHPDWNRRVLAHVGVPGHSRAALRNGELTTGVSHPCVPGGEHQKGCPRLVAPKLTQTSMGPRSTLTTRRLDLSLGHLPLPATSPRPGCQLHKYSGSRFDSKHVMACSICNVMLCARCFYSFHMDANPQPAACPPAP